MSRTAKIIVTDLVYAAMAAPIPPLPVGPEMALVTMQILMGPIPIEELRWRKVSNKLSLCIDDAKERPTESLTFSLL